MLPGFSLLVLKHCPICKRTRARRVEEGTTALSAFTAPSVASTRTPAGEVMQRQATSGPVSQGDRVAECAQLWHLPRRGGTCATAWCEVVGGGSASSTTVVRANSKFNVMEI